MVAGPPAPDPWAASAALLAEGARFVMVGGFAVVANQHIRATKDVDFLIPDDAGNDERCLRAIGRLDGRLIREGNPPEPDDMARDHVRVVTTAGIIDLIREGIAPIDFTSVADAAHRVSTELGDVLIAGLASVVAMKRLAGRPQDLADLDALERIHGSLPEVRIPGLDD